MDKKLSRRVSRRPVETGLVKAVGVWFCAQNTKRYLYLLRNDSKHPNSWGLPGGKIETGETLLAGMERECIEELGIFPSYLNLVPIEKFTSPDSKFEYYTWLCVIEKEFIPTINNEHTGYAWVKSGQWPKPLHPGLWSTINIEEVQSKILSCEQYLGLTND